jgi:hypothetical protein
MKKKLLGVALVLPPFRERLAPCREHLAPFREQLAPSTEWLAPFKEHLAPFRELSAILDHVEGSGYMPSFTCAYVSQQPLAQSKPQLKPYFTHETDPTG